MGAGALRLVSIIGVIAIVRLISAAIAFVIRIAVRLRIATAALVVPVTVVVVLIKAAALIAVFLESMGGRTQGVRRGPHGLGEAALETALAHLLPLGKIQSASEIQNST